MRVSAGVLMILSVFGGLPWMYGLVIYGYVMFVFPVFVAMFLAGTGASATLKRKHYTLAFAGAICSLMLLPIFGIPALILLLKRKREFEEEKENADAYPKQGDVYYYEAGPYGHVIAYYSKSIALDPNSALAFYNRGLAYREKGEVTKAVSDLEKCIGLSSDGELTKAAKRALSEIKNSPWEH